MGKTHKADRLDSKIIHEIRHGTLEKLKAVVKDALAHPEQGQLDDDLLAEALYRSCELDKVEFVTYWLEYPVSPKHRVEHAQTPLMVAKSRAVAKALIEKGAEIDAKDDAGKTALMQTRTVEVAEFLIQRKASLEMKDKQGNTALMNMLLVERQSQKPLSVQIANLLIDKGAKVNAEDHQGRTVLTTAVWMNHVELVERLVKKGAEVDKLDVRGRNVLHHLCEDSTRAAKFRAGDQGSTDGDRIMIKTLLKASPDPEYINRRENIEKRTPLHWALLLNHDALIHALLDNTPAPSVKATDNRLRTALHIAARNGRHEFVQKLLAAPHGAAVDAESSGGWQPMHFAAAGTQDSVETVKALLAKGAKVNALTSLKKTALHLAAESGNMNIVRHLLSVEKIEVTKRDVFGNSALLCAAKAAHKSIVGLLANYSIDALDKPSRKVAEETKAMVVDFDSENKSGPQLTPRRIFDLIYGGRGGPRVSPLPETTPTETSDTSMESQPDLPRSDTVRWIHLPANNTFWCRGLLIKLFLEDNGIDGETFQALLRSFDHQHKGKHLHARYMRPTFHHNSKTTHVDLEGTSAASSDPNDNDHARSQHGLHASDHRRQSHKGRHAQKRKHRHDDSLESVPTIGSLSEDPETDQGQPEVHPAGDDLDSVPNNMYLFLPYLHFEKFHHKREMNRVIRRVQPSPAHGQLPKEAARAALYAILEPQLPTQQWWTWPLDQQTILAHANSENPTLQIRRTLDQFFYRTIDTSERDRDQVVHRYQKTMSTTDETGEDANILMVDQLWMWIVNENLVITSFPRRWNTDNDDHGVWESIFRDLQATPRSHVFDAYELATIISGHCFGWIDTREFWHDDTLFLDMFDSSIGHAMDKEVKLFKAFRKASSEASTWLRKIKGRPVDDHAENSPTFPNLYITEDVDENEEEEGKSSRSERVFVHSLLDIGAETRLLEEVKDIRDELDMLRMIYTIQKELVPDMHKQILHALRRQRGTSARQARIRQLHQDQMRYITNPLRDIDRMERQTIRIYDSITALLDLKQKHANSIQATETQRQGNTLMVFTIVTVIFLPLSFLAAFFAINLTSFPHDQHGHSTMSIGYVSKYVLGIGIGLALICVFFAWNAERIDIARMYAQRWIKEQVFSPDFQLGSKTGQHQQQRRRRKRSDGRTETDLSANKIFA